MYHDTGHGTRGTFFFANFFHMKTRTHRQVETAKGRAEAFARNVLKSDDQAEQIAAESVDEYATRKRITISNPARKETRSHMATKQELEKIIGEQTVLIEELEDELGDLRRVVKEAADLLPDDDDEDEDEDEDESEEEDDDEDEDDDDDEDES